MNAATGIILAGGKATRMGRDKATVEFRGRPMIRHVAEALQDAGLEVLVVGRDAPLEDLKVIPDIPHPASGPAVGLLSALGHPDVTDVFLVAVDQPLLQPMTIKAMLATTGDVVVPMAAGHPQVTCALYRQSCRGPLEDMLATGQHKLRRILDAVATNRIDESVWSTWDEDGRSWMSLDTPQAVRDAEALR